MSTARKTTSKATLALTVAVAVASLFFACSGIAPGQQMLILQPQVDVLNVRCLTNFPETASQHIGRVIVWPGSRL